jgi:CheY-like chemotaxis protein
MTPSLRLLIADDNEESVFLLQAYLTGQPAVIDTASNGMEAIEKRRHKQYDLMLMDIQMPILDGLAAARAIRKWEHEQAAPPVPILALTAHSTSEAGLLCREAGCNGYLSKPIEKDQLLNALSEFMKEKAPEPVDPAIAALQPRYLANRRSDLEKVNAAREKGDFDVIRKLAHDWKGSGAGYGFPEISQVGRELEQAAIRRDAADVAAWIGEMENRVGRLMTA